MLGEKKCPDLVYPTKPELCEKFEDKTLDENYSRLYYFLASTSFLTGKVFPNWSTRTSQIYYRYEITDENSPFVNIRDGFQGVTVFDGCPTQPERFVRVDRFGKKCEYIRTLVYDNMYLFPVGAMHSGRKYVLGFTKHRETEDDIELLRVTAERDWLSSIYCKGYADWSVYPNDSTAPTQQGGDIIICDIGEYELPIFDSWAVTKEFIDNTFEAYSELTWKDFMSRGYTWAKIHNEELTWEIIHLMGSGVTQNNLDLYNA